MLKSVNRFFRTRIAILAHVVRPSCDEKGLSIPVGIASGLGPAHPLNRPERGLIPCRGYWAVRTGSSRGAAVADLCELLLYGIVTWLPMMCRSG